MIQSLVLNKLRKFPFFVVIVLSLFITIFVSCTKTPNKIGAEIMPDDSQLKVFWSDSSSLYAYSETVDSIRSDNLPYNYLGSVADPVFGSSIAGIYTQFGLSTLKHDFGPNPQMDSLILQLAYAGYYGDTTSILIGHAYEIQENFEADEEYYSNLLLPISSVDYLNYAFAPRPNNSTIEIDTIANDTTPIGPIQRFDLGSYDPGLANKLLSVTPEDSIMINTDKFRNFFNGLYLVTEPISQKGSLLRFDLKNSKSGMVLYYRNDTADSLRFGYTISPTTSRVNRYEHNYSNASADFINQTINGDTTLGSTRFYAQGFGSVRGVIKFPFLKEWARKGKIGINEVKLFFSGYEEEPYNGAPAAMLLVKAKEDGDYELIEDQYQGESYYDGVYKSSTNEYVFRITNHIQNLISDTNQVDYGLYVMPNASSYNPKRFIFNGNQPENDTIGKLRMEIIYTDLN
jgi:hypothetical protein